MNISYSVISSKTCLRNVHLYLLHMLWNFWGKICRVVIVFSAFSSYFPSSGYLGY